MVGGNAYATTKAVFEAHTVNLAAELRGTGVTVNAYRPGRVDTAMQAWIRQQDPERIGVSLHERFTRNYAEGTLITPEHSAALATGDRQQESGEVLPARTAGRQVSGDTGVAPGHEVDIDVQDGHRLTAAHIARIGPQEPLQSAQLFHRCSKPGSSK
jgi:hypothetical protein